MNKILVVGQTPPPFHGQSIMIDQMLKGNYKNVKLYHVRMHFSHGVDDIGRFQLGKMLHLPAIITKIIFYKFRYNIKILYYPPAGPNKVPVLRDLLILFFTRFLFKRVIFHFHAGGVSTIYEQLPAPLRWLYRKCYFYPDAALRLSEFNPADSEFLHAKKEFIVPNGIEDNARHFTKNTNPTQTTPNPCRILYVGTLKETKGLLVLIEACKLLKEKGLDFTLEAVGEFESVQFQETVAAKAAQYQLTDRVVFPGVLTGEEKFEKYADADIFCFPTFFESETFGIVLLEAMQFSLPIVATRWRGVQSVVRDRFTGFLVPIRDSAALADKLALLITNPTLREEMSTWSREIFLQEYTIEKFHENMENVFLSASTKE
ncbi:MAG: glycosyltransferase [Acidobacteria bacterium]|jgi:glycosyltransferase involved in cell wall biosynthesis|nr:glycosyltransferase [Acidobacteriota bacterium]